VGISVLSVCGFLFMVVTIQTLIQNCSAAYYYVNKNGTAIEEFSSEKLKRGEYTEVRDWNQTISYIFFGLLSLLWYACAVFAMMDVGPKISW
jgi:hypothetical protein